MTFLLLLDSLSHRWEVDNLDLLLVYLGFVSIDVIPLWTMEAKTASPAQYDDISR